MCDDELVDGMELRSAASAHQDTMYSTCTRTVLTVHVQVQQQKINLLLFLFSFGVSMADELAEPAPNVGLFSMSMRRLTGGAPGIVDWTVVCCFVPEEI